jgi:hypothetical protein
MERKDPFHDTIEQEESRGMPRNSEDNAPF